VLAAAIQDYNRGLIVGSRTYGKATGQDIFPLSGLAATTAASNNTADGVGYVKITTERLYRVTGKSAQGRGITPDLSIPDAFEVLQMRESATPFSLKPDSIPANTYYRPLRPINIKELQGRSVARLTNNAVFQEMRQSIRWLEGEVKRANLPDTLSWKSYLKRAKGSAGHRSQREIESHTADRVYEVVNTSGKEARLAVDEYARAENERWLKILTSDFYLRETYQVLRDYVTLMKKP
jgi:carboxyl-terminal processing protease